METDTLPSEPKVVPTDPSKMTVEQRFMSELKPKTEPEKVIQKQEAKTETVKASDPKAMFRKEETKIEVKSEIDAIDDPEFKGEHAEKRKSEWGTLKAKAKSFEDQVSALQKERDDAMYKAGMVDSTKGELDKIRAELTERDTKLAEYSKLVERAHLEEHPEFRKLVTGRDEIVSRAKTIISESGGDAEAVATALNLKGKPRADALREIAGDLDTFQSSRLGRAIDELDSLDKQIGEKRDKAGEYLKQLAQQDQEVERTNRDQHSQKIQKAYDAAMAKLKKELEVLREVPDAVEWNAIGPKIDKEARQNWANNSDPEHAAENEIRARAMPVYRDLYVKEIEHSDALQKKLEEATVELKSIYEKSPTLRGNSGASQKGEKPTFMDAYNGVMNGTIPV